MLLTYSVVIGFTLCPKRELIEIGENKKAVIYISKVFEFEILLMLLYSFIY